MSTRPIPSLIGQIYLLDSVNDQVHWHEDDGSSTADLTITLPTPGGDRYVWPFDLATELQAAMDAESAGSGLAFTYRVTFDVVTCLFRISIDTGSGVPTMYLKLTSAEGRKLLTGGDNDSNGDPLYAGQQGFDHCGFLTDGSYPAPAFSWDAQTMCANCWTTNVDPNGEPAEPVATDSERDHKQARVVEATSLDGSGHVVYDFTGWHLDRDDLDFPRGGQRWATRTLSYQYVQQSDRDHWIDWFWGPYAKGGGTFRYYEDRANLTRYWACRLTGDSLTNDWGGERRQSYSTWGHTFTIRRVSVV